MALQSMTGFGEAAGEVGGTAWRWELKSVNARGLDLRFRVPGGFDSVERAVRPLAQKRLTRGSVSAGLAVRGAGGGARARLDHDALTEAMIALDTVRDRLRDDGYEQGPVSPATVLALPDVMVRQEAEGPDMAALMPELVAGFGAALEALVAERAAEGSRLARVVGEQVDRIAALTRDAEACAGEAVAVLRERLDAQVAELAGGGVAPERLEQEVALLATKADVREEIDRLDAHVEAARALLAEGGAVGRRLDFLTQEFNREANTLCSKSPVDRLTRIGLDLKAVIDQLREQAANIE